MTCEHCTAAEDLFSDKEAKKSLKRYYRKGARKTSKTLISLIKTSIEGEKSILDIGSGIGAVNLELLESGLASATQVDASKPYLDMASELAEKKGLRDRINQLHGDFMDKTGELSPHDIVILDKVICCYPHMSELITAASSKTNSMLALVYPRANFIGKIMIGLANTIFWFKKSAFRTYMHSNKKVVEVLNNQGLILVQAASVYPWNIEVYKRTGAA
ncbi:MAG: methyltransferase domain-containing protein [Vicingaceae bacterium]